MLSSAYAQMRRCANIGCNNTAGEDSALCTTCNLEQNLPPPEFGSSQMPRLQLQQQGNTQNPYSQPAPGRNMGTDNLKPARQLCRIAGCSFTAVSELGGFCPDCYDEHCKGKSTPQQRELQQSYQGVMVRGGGDQGVLASGGGGGGSGVGGVGHYSPSHEDEIVQQKLSIVPPQKNKRNICLAAHQPVIQSAKGEAIKTESVSEDNTVLCEQTMTRVEVSRQHEEICMLCKQALTRADAIEKRLEEAEARIDASERRAEQASTRADAIQRSLEETEARADASERRAEQAIARAETAEIST